MSDAPTKSRASEVPRVAVVGGGISGLAAAARLAEAGFHVELFEAASRLGGRAASFEEPSLGAWSTVAAMWRWVAAPELLRFAKDFEIEDCFTKHRRLHFFSPTGEKHDFESVRRLPTPLHLLPGFWRTPYLGRKDKLRIMRLLGKLMWIKPRRCETALEWLHREGQSDTAIRRFWSVVLISALSDSLDRVDARAARKVFRDGFLGRRNAYELYVPSVPLSKSSTGGSETGSPRGA